jgi:hypothetical protein
VIDRDIDQRGRPHLIQVATTRARSPSTAKSHFADGRADNLAESRTRVLLHAALLPPMTPQVFIYDETFVLVGIADLAAIGRGTLVEFDGRAKYGIDDQDVRTQLIAEKMRGDHMSDLGYELARAMWEDLSDPAPGAASAASTRSGRGETAAARLLPAQRASARPPRTGGTVPSSVITSATARRVRAIRVPEHAHRSH